MAAFSLNVEENYTEEWANVLKNCLPAVLKNFTAFSPITSLKPRIGERLRSIFSRLLTVPLKLLLMLRPFRTTSRAGPHTSELLATDGIHVSVPYLSVRWVKPFSGEENITEPPNICRGHSHISGPLTRSHAGMFDLPLPVNLWNIWVTFGYLRCLSVMCLPKMTWQWKNIHAFSK